MIHDSELRERLAPLARTVETIVPERELLEKLRAKPSLRCKFGIDPTSTTVHIGNGIQLWNLRRLQDLGHTAVLILGDYTATVGDPSGKDKTRPMLTPEQVEANLATWMEQMSLILDMDKVEIRRNSEWFKDMSFLEVLELTNRMTVQQMMERDSFETRWTNHEPISVREFLYCLMQGWDSVMVEADVELGGTDQTFNLTVGRRLMEQEGMAPQVSLIGPLLEGTDGSEKMSKSLGNAIGLTDAPKDVFGMAMRVSDELMPKYMRLVTDLADDEIETLLAGSPMDAKLAMAAALVARYHGADAGAAEREEFLRVFRRHEAPSEIPEVARPDPEDDGSFWIVNLLKHCGFASSTGEAKRLIQGGGVRLDETVQSDWQARLTLDGGEVLRVGRRKYARLI
ncbi:MAG: tyrosine--tRNA ligase [Planctomycetota bacterium]|nr:tyrosine--tRNA ligase [Planctomycetota bacterium]